MNREELRAWILARRAAEARERRERTSVPESPSDAIRRSLGLIALGGQTAWVAASRRCGHAPRRRDRLRALGATACPNGAVTTSGESAILAALAALAEALTESRAAGPRPQHTWMKFGGHHLRGDLTPFLPWLALGEWMHIGGKTSFGLGRYTIEPPRQG